jgi:hypothetical protein
LGVILRAALDARAPEVGRFFLMPAPNTAVGHLILKKPRLTAHRFCLSRSKNEYRC